MADKKISLFDMTTLPNLTIQQHWIIITGKVTDGIIMSLVMNNSFPNQKLLRITDTKLATALGSSPQPIRKARRRLCAAGYITTVQSGSPLTMTYIPNLKNIEKALNDYAQSGTYELLQDTTGSYDGINTAQITYINHALSDPDFKAPDDEDWDNIETLWVDILDAYAKNPANITGLGSPINLNTYQNDTCRLRHPTDGSSPIKVDGRQPELDAKNADDAEGRLSNAVQKPDLPVYITTTSNNTLPLNNTDINKDKSKDNNKGEQPRKSRQNKTHHYAKDTIPYMLASVLMYRITDRVPEGPYTNAERKEQTIQSWADHMRLMLEVDEWKKETILATIDWCQDDDFWCNNIMSGKKLRAQMERLVASMKQHEGKATVPRNTYPELVRAITRRYENKFLGGKHPEWSVKDQTYFIEAAEKAATFARQTKVKEVNLPKYLITCMHNYYIEDGHGKNVLPGYLSSDLVWNILLPQYLKDLGVTFNVKVK